MVSVAFSPNGTQVLVNLTDENVGLWNIVLLGEVAVYGGHAGSISIVALIPDGFKAASEGADTTMRLRSNALMIKSHSF
jgi:WD40 repeat protein